MDYIGDLQRIAMNAVENPTYEDWLRKIRRWFSKEYSTPILQVEDFEDEYVILAYYEHLFEQMDPDARRAKMLELTESAQEKEARVSEDKAFDETLMKEMQAEFKELEKKKAQLALGKPAKKPKPIIEKVPDEPIVFEFKDPDIKD